MNNLEAWDIIRKKYMDEGSGINEFNDPAQYILAYGGDRSVLVRGEFDVKELRAIGWYLSSPEEFEHLRYWNGKEDTEVLSSPQNDRA